jgi:hypothetical protein
VRALLGVYARVLSAADTSLHDFSVSCSTAAAAFAGLLATRAPGGGPEDIAAAVRTFASDADVTDTALELSRKTRFAEDAVLPAMDAAISTFFPADLLQAQLAATSQDTDAPASGADASETPVPNLLLFAMVSGALERIAQNCETLRLLLPRSTARMSTVLMALRSLHQRALCVSRLGGGCVSVLTMADRMDLPFATVHVSLVTAASVLADVLTAADPSARQRAVNDSAARTRYCAFVAAVREQWAPRVCCFPLLVCVCSAADVVG